MSEVKPWKLANTYGDNANDEGSISETASTASNATKGGSTSADGNIEVGDDGSSASVIRASAQTGEDSAARAAEDVEGVIDGGFVPLRNDVGDNAGEGHSTGSEDSKDGGKTHDEEALEGYFG